MPEDRDDYVGGEGQGRTDGRLRAAPTGVRGGDSTPGGDGSRSPD